MRGIRDILNTGIIFGDSILIIADTKLVTTMTRIFITSIIVARGEVGIKDSMAFVPLGPPALELPVLDFIPLGLPVLDIVPLEPPVLEELPVLDIVPLGPPVLDIILPGVLVLDIVLPGVPVLDIILPGVLVLDIVPLGVAVLDIILPGVLVLAVAALQPVLVLVRNPPAVVNLGKLLLLRKNISSSSPTRCKFPDRSTWGDLGSFCRRNQSLPCLTH